MNGNSRNRKLFGKMQATGMRVKDGQLGSLMKCPKERVKLPRETILGKGHIMKRIAIGKIREGRVTTNHSLQRDNK